MTFLHLIGDWLRDTLALVPLPVVRLLFVALPLVVLIWVIRLPREAAAETAAAGWSRNLKVWAAVALIIQILIYSLV